MLFHIDHFKLNTDMHVKIALNNHYRGELLVRLSLNKLLRHEKKTIEGLTWIDLLDMVVCMMSEVPLLFIFHYIATTNQHVCIHIFVYSL